MGFIISCDEATTICDKNQYGEASLYDKIRLNWHLFMCKFCMSYTKQNNIMSQIFGKNLKPCEGLEKMSEEEKKELEKNLRNELNK
ncbi:hypothetical protein [Lutimonas sp.]|uniref:hypothetical protein n=1 Tax=Lutimonas sp. TaxID=1872403 RepID=UPI003D9B3C7C